MACAQCLATGENYVLREDTSAPGGNRTPDLDVRTVLLYPLSYEGVWRDQESLPRVTPLSPTLPPERGQGVWFSAFSQGSHRVDQAASVRVETMENTPNEAARIKARDAA